MKQLVFSETGSQPRYGPKLSKSLFILGSVIWQTFTNHKPANLGGFKSCSNIGVKQV